MCGEKRGVGRKVGKGLGDGGENDNKRREVVLAHHTEGIASRSELLSLH